MKTEDLLNLTDDELHAYAERINDDANRWARLGDKNIHNLRIEQLDTIRRVWHARMITRERLK